MNINNQQSHDNMVLIKYNIFVSTMRNVFTSSVIGLAVLGGGTSSILFDNVQLKPYVKIMGIFLLIISVLYGWNNINDLDNYVNKRKIINDKTNMINNDTTNTDILLLKLYLIVLVFVIIAGITTLFY